MNKLSLVALFAVIVCPLAAFGVPHKKSTKNNAPSISRYIIFGGRVNGSCKAKGLCRTLTANEPPTADAVLVEISVDPFNSHQLIFKFSLNELRVKNREQYSLFLPPNDRYSFDALYPLTDPVFQELQLEPNARIIERALHSIERMPNGNDTLVIYRVIYTHS